MCNCSSSLRNIRGKTAREGRTCRYSQRRTKPKSLLQTRQRESRAMLRNYKPSYLTNSAGQTASQSPAGGAPKASCGGMTLSFCCATRSTRNFATPSPKAFGRDAPSTGRQRNQAFLVRHSFCQDGSLLFAEALATADPHCQTTIETIPHPPGRVQQNYRFQIIDLLDHFASPTNYPRAVVGRDVCRVGIAPPRVARMTTARYPETTRGIEPFKNLCEYSGLAPARTGCSVLQSSLPEFVLDCD